MRVEVNATKTKVSKPNGLRFLGFSFYFKEGKYRPKPHIKSEKNLKAKLRKETRRSVSTSIADKISKLNPIIRGGFTIFVYAI